MGAPHRRPEEVVPIDLVCDACGESNPPGTEFCRNCNSFLAWDRSAATTAPQPVTPPVHPVGAAAPTPTTVAADPPTAPLPPPEQAYPDPGNEQAYTQEYEQGYSQDYEQGYGPGVPPAEISCPGCGTVNPGTRRFCSHCGYGFFSEQWADPYADGELWSPASIAARDREARRAYRRSLPPLYRWRRVLITVLVVVLVGATGVLLRQNPVRLAKDGWYGLTKRYVPVNGVQARVEPAEATAAGSDPAALVDRSVKEWTMNWAPTAESTCGAAEGTGTVVLSFPPTRIRRIQIVPGLDASNPQRDLQPLPRTLGISFDGGTCQPVALSPAPNPAVVKLDSGRPVTEVRIGIGATFPAGADAQPVISLTEVSLKAYPS